MPPFALNPAPKFRRVELDPQLAIDVEISIPVAGIDRHRFPSGVVVVPGAGHDTEGIRADVELELRAVEEGGGGGDVGEDGIGCAGSCVICLHCINLVVEQAAEEGGGIYSSTRYTCVSHGSLSA